MQRLTGNPCGRGQRDVALLSPHAHPLAQHGHASEADAGGYPPRGGGGWAGVDEREEEVDDVDGGGEVHALLGSLHNEEEEESTGGKGREGGHCCGVAWYSVAWSATGQGLAVMWRRSARRRDKVSNGTSEGEQTTTMKMLSFT